MKRFLSAALARRLPGGTITHGRMALLASAIIATSSVASGHFVFVVPDETGHTANVILSETLEVDDGIDPAIVDGVKLVTRDASGAEGAIELVRDGDTRLVRLPEKKRGVVHGTLTHGVMTHGTKPFLVVYHPKACLGSTLGSSARVGKESPAELVPAGIPGNIRFQLLAAGEPVTGANVTVLLPDGDVEEVETDAAGYTPSYSSFGRYAARARHVVPVSGEHDGEGYAEVRHYPTIVLTVSNRHTGAAKATHPMLSATEKLPPLPIPVSSLGAVASAGQIYVYGGHTAPVHTYSTEAVTGRFFRRPLDGKAAWEELPSGPGLQGMNIAAHRGRIYRVGGMDPRNKPEEPAENFSVASVACFDPATKTWADLPPMPEPRSSHDVAIVGDTLYVVGGWNMLGHDGEEWCDTMLSLELGNPGSGWKTAPQPFVRRALIAAVNDGKLYVIGGFTDEEDISLDVDIFNPVTGAWSKGPALPGDSMNGFAPAACTIAGQIHVSIADGSIHRLTADGSRWEPVAAVVPRIVHRAVPDGDSHMILVGGAANAANLDLVERVPVR